MKFRKNSFYVFFFSFFSFLISRKKMPILERRSNLFLIVPCYKKPWLLCFFNFWIYNETTTYFKRCTLMAFKQVTKLQTKKG